MKIDTARLATAQAMLKAIAPHVSMEWDRGFWFSWESLGKPVRLKWRAQSQGSDYPVWYNRRPFGGTCCRAVTQLMHWVRGKPVVPLRVWRYWCGKEVGMNAEAVWLATAAGWPEDVPCVFCRKTITPADRFDWYDCFGRDGPGCVPGCEAWRTLCETDRRFA